MYKPTYNCLRMSEEVKADLRELLEGASDAPLPPEADWESVSFVGHNVFLTHAGGTYAAGVNHDAKMAAAHLFNAASVNGEGFRSGFSAILSQAEITGTAYPTEVLQAAANTEYNVFETFLPLDWFLNANSVSDEKLPAGINFLPYDTPVDLNVGPTLIDITNVPRPAFFNVRYNFDAVPAVSGTKLTFRLYLFGPEATSVNDTPITVIPLRIPDLSENGANASYRVELNTVFFAGETFSTDEQGRHPKFAITIESDNACELTFLSGLFTITT